MTTWAGVEFGWVQITSALIIIGVWFAIAFFGWKFFMENPMAKTGNKRKKPGSDRKQSLPPRSLSE